jgi:hypothetical protein
LTRLFINFFQPSFKLMRNIRQAQETLVAIADKAPRELMPESGAISLEAFLQGLRIAWRGGEVRLLAAA